jgi:hypothetical protein
LEEGKGRCSAGEIACFDLNANSCLEALRFLAVLM